MPLGFLSFCWEEMFVSLAAPSSLLWRAVCLSQVNLISKGGKNPCIPSTPIYTSGLEKLPIQPLPTASITLANRFRRASDQIYTLLEIAEDGIIDERERPEFDAIVADLRETIAAAYQVIYADGAKKERPETGISKRSVSQRLNSENDCKNSIAYSRGNASPVLSKGVYAR